MKERSLKERLRAAYLDYVNDYLTVGRFAQAHGLTEEQGHDLIALGRSVHEKIVADHKRVEQVTGLRTNLDRLVDAFAVMGIPEGGIAEQAAFTKSELPDSRSVSLRQGYENGGQSIEFMFDKSGKYLNFRFWYLLKD